MPTRGNPLNVALGPGYLRYAVLGTADPTLTVNSGIFAVTYDAAWIGPFYTDQGSSFSYAPSFENVEVAEELDPIDSVATGRECKVSFSAAELTAKMWQLAMNGGTITVAGTAPDTYESFTPPALGTEVQKMLAFESEDHKELWVWRQCKQTGSIQTDRQKGANKGLIPMEFSVFNGDFELLGSLRGVSA